jgi:hypothetical protein
MQRINWTRVILGGLLAGVVINIGEFLVNGILLADRWAAGMKALNRSSDLGALPYVIFNLWGFLIGLFALWLYATIRPRFGAGPRTAVIAAIATWVPGSLLASMAPMALHLFSRRLFAFGVACALVEIVLGTLIGGWLYKEREPAPPAAAAAA